MFTELVIISLCKSSHAIYLTFIQCCMLITSQISKKKIFFMIFFGACSEIEINVTR